MYSLYLLVGFPLFCSVSAFCLPPKAGFPLRPLSNEKLPLELTSLSQPPGAIRSWTSKVMVGGSDEGKDETLSGWWALWANEQPEWISWSLVDQVNADILGVEFKFFLSYLKGCCLGTSSPLSAKVVEGYRSRSLGKEWNWFAFKCFQPCLGINM